MLPVTMGSTSRKNAFVPGSMNNFGPTIRTITIRGDYKEPLGSRKKETRRPNEPAMTVMPLQGSGIM